MKKTRIAVLILICISLILWGISLNALQELTMGSIPISLLALPLLLWIVMLFTKLKNKKILLLIPFLIMIGLMTIAESWATSVVSPSTGVGNFVAILIFAYLVVSMVFALNAKKWAMISVIVLLSIQIFSTFSMINTILVNEALIKIQNQKNIYSFMVCSEVTIFVVYTTLLVYFCGLFAQKKMIQGEENLLENPVE